MEIDTSKLQPGMVVKNYKELCGLLGVKPTGGNAKKKLLDTLQEYIKYSKIGRTYKIEEVLKKPIMFSKPLSRRDRRKKRPKNIYIKFVELILMQYLTNSTNKGKMEVTKIGMFKLLGLVNNKFNIKVCEDDFLKKYADMPDLKNSLKFVKNRAYKKMDSILNTALHSLENKRIILPIPTYYITTEDDMVFEANENDMKLITNLEYIAMRKIGVTEYWEIFSNDKTEQFYSIFNQSISEFQWKKVDKKIKILFENSVIVQEIKDTELELQKILLNEEFVEYMKKNVRDCPSVEYNSEISNIYFREYDLIIKSFIAYLSSA